MRSSRSPGRCVSTTSRRCCSAPRRWWVRNMSARSSARPFPAGRRRCCRWPRTPSIWDCAPTTSRWPCSAGSSTPGCSWPLPQAWSTCCTGGSSSRRCWECCWPHRRISPSRLRSSNREGQDAHETTPAAIAAGVVVGYSKTSDLFAVQTLLDIIASLGGGFTSLLAFLLQIIRGVFIGLADPVASGVQVVLKALGGGRFVVEGLVGALLNGLAGVFHRITDVFGGVGHGLPGRFHLVFRAVLTGSQQTQAGHEHGCCTKFLHLVLQVMIHRQVSHVLRIRVPAMLEQA